MWMSTSALEKSRVKRIFTRRYLEEGGYIPKYYGIAYRDFDTDSTVCYVIPLNLIAWFWHEKLRYWIKQPPRDDEMWRVFMLGHKQGLERATHRSIQVVSGWPTESWMDEYNKRR